MNRALIAFLFRCWLAELLPTLCLGWLFFLNLFWRQPVTHLLELMVAIMALRAFESRVAYGERCPSLWLWRVSHRVVGFCTMTSGRILLLFPPGLDESLDLHEVILWSESDLDDLSHRFGIRRPRRLTVVLISSHRNLTEDFGRPMGAPL